MFEHPPFDPEYQILDESWAVPPEFLCMDEVIAETDFEHGWKSVTLPYSGTLR